MSDPFIMDEDLTRMMSTVYTEDSDALAKALPYARNYGVSLDFAKENEKPLAEDYASERVREDLEKFKASPFLRKYIEEPDNYRLVKDDADSLSAIGNALKYTPVDIGVGLGGGMMQTGWGTLAVTSALASKYVGQPIDRAMEWAGIAPKYPLDPFADISVGAQRMFEYNQRATEKALKPALENAGPIASAYHSAVQSVAQQTPSYLLGMTTKSPWLTAGLFGLQTGGQSAGQALSEGYSPELSLYYGLQQGVIEAGTEEIPVARLFGDMKAGSPLLKILVDQYVREIPGEMTATALQNFSTWATLHPDKPFQTYLDELPSDEAQTVLSTLFSVGAQTSTLTVLNNMMRKQYEKDVAEQAKARVKAGQDLISRVAELAKSGNLVNRSPEELARVVQGMADEAGADKVYIPAEKLAEFFQPKDGKAPDFETFAAYVPEAEKLDDILAHGGDVEIPTGNIVAALAADEQFAGLTEFLRLQPEFDPEAYDLGEIDMADLEDANLGLSEGEQVFQRVYDQFINTGETPDSARLLAGMVREYYQTASQRYGDNEELQARLDELVTMLSVRREIDKSVRSSLEEQYGSLFAGLKEAQAHFQKEEAAQKESTSLFGKTQKKKREVRPTPIISWLQSRGGVKRGSKAEEELSVLGVTPKSHSRLYRRMGKYSDLDNIPASEFNDSFGDVVQAKDDGNGYVDRQWLLDAIRDESFGQSPALSQEVRNRDIQVQNFEALKNELDRAGIDILTADPAQVVKALVPDAEVPTMALNQGAVKTDTPEFKAWFGDSKVVDENGNPLVVYHGSPNEFEKFQHDYIGTQGTNEGRGFYFTDSRVVADQYGTNGKTYEVYLSIQKPLDFEKLTVTKAQLKKFIKAFDPSGDDYLSNYGDAGYEGYDAVLNSAVENLLRGNDNDVDLFHDIQNASGAELQAFYKTLTDVLGYDGIIVQNPEWGKQTIYLTFQPEQIKSIHNRGTFDPNDARILYQKDNGLRSSLLDAAGALKQDKGTGEQYLAQLRKTPGVKEEEIAWTGLDEFLKGKKSVTKQEIVDYLDQNQVRIEEVTLGQHEPSAGMWSAEHIGGGDYDVFIGNEHFHTYAADSSADAIEQARRSDRGKKMEKEAYNDTKFSQYTLPGGENYREVLLTLPQGEGTGPYEKLRQEADALRNRKLGEVLPDGRTVQQTLDDIYRQQAELQEKEQYKSSHFEQPNILAHVRLNDRTDADGKKVLFIEEIQSDFGQALRKQRQEAEKSLDDRWGAILDRMKKDGILEVVCP